MRHRAPEPASHHPPPLLGGKGAVAFVWVIAIATIMARLTCFIAANAARPLVADPMIAHVNEAASAIVLEHMRLMLAAAIENSASPARLILVEFSVKFLFWAPLRIQAGRGYG